MIILRRVDREPELARQGSMPQLADARHPRVLLPADPAEFQHALGHGGPQRPLASSLEKRLEQLRCTGRQHTTLHLDTVVVPRLVNEVGF